MSETLTVAAGEEKKTLWEVLAATMQESIHVSAKYSSYQKISTQHVPFFLLKVQGYTISEIAEITSEPRSKIGAVLRSAAGVRLLTDLHMEIGRLESEDVMVRMKTFAHEALDTAIDVMRTSDEDAVRLKSAMGILDRAGYGTVQKSESVIKVEISDERADLLNLALRESMNLGDGDFEIVTMPAAE